MPFTLFRLTRHGCKALEGQEYSTAVHCGPRVEDWLCDGTTHVLLVTGVGYSEKSALPELSSSMMAWEPAL
jgi:hypothetical protein